MTTTGSKGSVSRETIVCRFITKEEAMTAASIQAFGMAPWPPRPLKSTEKISADAKLEPTRHEAVPTGICDQICKPNTSSTPVIAPCATIDLAPCAFSSDG